MSDQKLNLERSCSNGGGRIWHAEALLPSSIKALDRLISALAHIPIAWLNQKKAKIELQTQAYALVEASIGKVAASEAGADKETVQRALDVLVRKEYRRCRKESWRSFSKASPGQGRNECMRINASWAGIADSVAVILRSYLTVSRLSSNQRRSEPRWKEMLALLVQPQDDLACDCAQREVAIEVGEEGAAA